MATAFENFVNTELPKRIATNESPTTPQAGDIPIYTGVGLLTESKTPSEAGLATEAFATNAANIAETSAKSYADGLVTSIYKFQTTYDPQTTGNFPTTANTVGGVAIKKGFTWVISGVTGQYTFQGVTVDNGDTLLALVDNASATSAADWHITEKNLGYTPENVSNKYSNNDLAGSAGTYPATPNVKAYVDNGLSGKQNTLVSGTNIKTVNGSSLLGSGDLTMEAGVIVVKVASGTVTLAANKNYLILATGNFTLNADALAAGNVVEIKSLLDSVVSTLTVTFAGTSSYYSELGGSAITNATVYPASTLTMLCRTGGIYYRRTGVQFASEFMLRKDGDSSLRSTFTNSGITANRVITLPDATFDLGDLSFVAKTNSNTLSGTRTHILGGQNNTVSGTDNLALGCTYTTLNSTNVVAVGCTGFDSYALATVQKAGVVLGTSLSPAEIIALTANYGAAAGAVQCLFTSVQSANGTTRNVTFDGTNTASNTNCVKLLAASSALGGAVHDIDLLIAVGTSDPLSPVRTIFAKRRVYVNNNGTVTTSVITIDTDTSVGTAATGTVTIGVTTDTANNRLIPTVNATSGSGQDAFQVSCRVTSHFNRK